MLPPIGSISMLAGQGRPGVVVDARALGESEGGRQLVALRVKTWETRNEAAADGGAPGVSSTADAAGSAGKTRNASSPPDDAARPSGPVSARRLDQLSASEKADVARLQQRDQQVRQEEKAHAAVAGDLAGPINYVYQRGPDGRQYAVGGAVGIQATAHSGDPAEARRFAGRMAAAANAATNPSTQDYASARQAYAFGSQLATSETHAERTPERSLTL